MTKLALRRSRASIGIPAFVLLLVLAFRPAQAQTAAGIVGIVTDESGAVLPGVTVTATSPSLQVPSMVAVSDTGGEYRLTPLPIGIYTVEYSLQGFRSVRRDDLRLTVGFTAKVDVALNVGSLEETITVSGAAPVVDVTSATTATSFTRETLELVPTSRNGLVGLMSQAPGVRSNVDVGGTTITEVPGSRLFGQAGEPWSTLEGVPTTAIQGSGGNANYWDYVTVEEAAVKTIGNDAEMPNRGISVTAVVKSGGNAFHGGGWYGFMSPELQSDNLTDQLRSQGISSGAPLVKRYDASGELGGKVIENKLWFYVSSRRRIDISQGTNAFKPDGSPATNDELSWFHTEKVSYQASPANRIVGFYQYNHKDTRPAGTQFVAYESTTAYTTLSRTGKIEWQGIRGSSLVLNAQYGNWGYDGIYKNNAPGKPAVLDQATLYQTGPSTSAGQRPQIYRHDFRGSMGLYRPDLFFGGHQFKIGYGFAINAFGRRYTINEDTPEYNYQLIYNNGAPFEVRTYNRPTLPKGLTHYSELFLKDTWSVGRRLTLDLGARFAYDNGFVPASCREAPLPPGNVAYPPTCFDKSQFNIWKSVVPRLHAAYVLGGGRTVLKGGWGRFAHMRMLDPEVANVDPNLAGVARYLWRDPNGNGLYDAGETNLDPNGPDFVSQTSANYTTNPNEKMPMSDEFSLSLERELMANFGVRVTGVYARNWNIYRDQNIFRPRESYTIPLTRQDPGVDGRVGTADDPGTSITYYEYPASLRGQRFERFQLINDPNIDQDFKSFEVGAFKRMSQGWQFMASFSATKKNIPLTVGSTQSEFNSNVYAGTDDPNAEINRSDRTNEVTGKLSGAYDRLPFNIILSANYEYRNGTPFARTVLFTGGQTVTSLVVNAEPIGTRRRPALQLMDVRVEKRVMLPKGQKAVVRANIFNALNRSTVTSLIDRSGPSFLQPTGILPPRIVELSVSYSF
jgi:hypothetical protein